MSDEPETIAYLRDMMANYLLDDLYLKDEMDAINGRELLAEIDTIRAERDALREMLTMYNVGGWTDLAAIIEDTKSARDRLAAAERVVEAAKAWNDAPREQRWHEEDRLVDALAALATPTTTEMLP